MVPTERVGFSQSPLKLKVIMDWLRKNIEYKSLHESKMSLVK